jgi:hypothetical protein
MSSIVWLLGVESHDFFQGWERKNCLQSWANSQNDNYFISKREPRIILSENSCHFVNLLSFEGSSFFLSMRKIMWQPKTRGHVEHPTDLSLMKGIIKNTFLKIFIFFSKITVKGMGPYPISNLWECETPMIFLLGFSTNLEWLFEWFSTILFYQYNFLYNFWNLLSFLNKLNFSTISGNCFHILYNFWNLLSCSLWFPFLFNSDATQFWACPKLCNFGICSYPLALVARYDARKMD